jgi:hypothetical protein
MLSENAEEISYERGDAVMSREDQQSNLKKDDDVDVVNVPCDKNQKTDELSILLPKNEDLSERDLDEDMPVRELMTEIKIPQELYKEFSFNLDVKYNNNSELKEKNQQLEINSLFRIGLNEIKRSMQTTSSTSLLYNGKPPRIDVLYNLAKIAFLFNNQKNCYPNFKPLQIIGLIKVGLGLEHPDPRTVEKYLKCIRANSVRDNLNGVINVETFFSQIPLDVYNKAKQELEEKWN